jgi:hypothetical protein
MTRNRSKELGKPVEELTREQLLSEKRRCEILIQVYGNKMASKGLRKRLYEIEKSLNRQAQ